MANEIAIPLLPCRSIDEMVDFYTMLGFRRIYYQDRGHACPFQAAPMTRKRVES